MREIQSGAETRRRARVSIIIAAYNVSGKIQRAIEGVQAQTIGDWELVIVDDASTDETADIAGGLAASDPRIRIIRQAPSKGPSAARNRGLAAASGEWIAILDADDVWRPQRLERMLDAAATWQCDFVADNQIRYDETLGREAGLSFDVKAEIEKLHAASLFTRDDPWLLGTMKPLIRRTALARASLTFDERLKFGEDFFLYTCLLFCGLRGVLMRDAYHTHTITSATRSRQGSSGSRSKTSLESLLWIIDTLGERYAQQSTSAVRDGMRRSREHIVRRLVFKEITRLREARSFGRLAFFVMARPHRAIAYARSSRTWRRIFSHNPVT